MASFNNNSASARYLKLQVQYGSDLHELLLTSKDNQICVDQLLDEIERRTKVPKCHQTLIYKGQRLDQTPKANLNELYIFNNSKLILSHTPKPVQDEHRYPKRKTDSVSEEKSIRRKEDAGRKVPSSFALEVPSHPTGFTPEPNKTYEYYTVPYRTDPATLLQNMPSPISSTAQQS